MFVSGFLALCSAVGPGTATEMSVPGYNRQAIRFNTALFGRAVSANPYTFGYLTLDALAGRAIYDAPTGGNLLLVLPLAAPRPRYLQGLADANEAGALHMQLDALAAFPDGDAYSGTFAAGALMGRAWDDAAIISRGVVDPATGSYVTTASDAPLSAGVALIVNRGVLMAAASVPAGW